jgi:D-alanyl-D-alanine carboxypeptidase
MADPLILMRVDKQKALSETFEPADLASLDGSGVSVSRPGHRLRAAALKALLLMNRAARKDEVTLLVGSAYRSYAYQAQVFARNVKESGQAEAERVSALPGHSQHQLGTALDFAPIDESFARTKASRWLIANARRFGFSLSFPKGMESVTGYIEESWHYRYIGVAAAALEGEYFGGVQQYLLLFLENYKEE